MTPEEFKARYRNKLASNYLSEEDKVLMTIAWQQMSAGERTSIQRALEASNSKKAIDLINKARRNLALTMADTRLDEITADGSVNLDSELDELL